jgi:hypothetical protein
MSGGPVNRYEAFYKDGSAIPRKLLVELPERDMLALRTRADAEGISVHQLAGQVLSAAAHCNGAGFPEGAL